MIHEKIDCCNMIKSLKYIFNINFFTNFFSSIKISKNSSAKYYQKTKIRLRKMIVKGIKIFLRKRITKIDDMVVNNIKISQKMKSKG